MPVLIVRTFSVKVETITPHSNYPHQIENREASTDDFPKQISTKNVVNHFFRLSKNDECIFDVLTLTFFSLSTVFRTLSFAILPFYCI